MSYKITVDQLKAITGTSATILEPYVDRINSPSVQSRYEVDTRLRMAMFIAQVCEESGCFKKTEENLNYSAKRITEVWPKRFPTLDSAKPYANNPEALANKVYSGRGGNGDEASGDGYRYRGRGLIQLTFKLTYQKFLDYLKWKPLDDEFLEWCLTVEGAVESAMWYFKTANINAYADRGDIEGATKAINGGQTNIAQRKIYYQKSLANLK